MPRGTSWRSSGVRSVSPTTRRFTAADPSAARVESAPVESELRTLHERLAEISDIQRSVGVLFWDQRVTMPPLGTPARANAVATLGRILHDRFVDDEIGSLL